MLLILLLQNSLKPSLQNEVLWFWGTLTILWNSLIQISWDSILISYQDSLQTTASLGSSFIILVVSKDPLELYSNKCYLTQSNASWTIRVKYCVTAQYNKLIKDLEWGTTPIDKTLLLTHYKLWFHDTVPGRNWLSKSVVKQCLDNDKQVLADNRYILDQGSY